MKYRVLVLFILLSLSMAFARIGGPDVYGYYFVDSEEPDVTFDWLDYSDGDIVEFIPPADDDATGVSLPFTFNFYDAEFDSIYVSTNGVIAFVQYGADDYSNDPIPNDNTPNSMVAVLWDDQQKGISDTIESEVYVLQGGEYPERWCAVTWVNWCAYYFYDDVWTYQAILHENPDGDGKIVLQYLDVHLDGSTTHDYGNSATVGIEDHPGTVGLQYSYNEPVLYDSLRIEFEVIEIVSRDVAVMDILSPTGVMIVIEGFTVDEAFPQAIIRNFGTEDLVDISVNCDISHIGGSSVYYEEIIMDSLLIGESDTSLFPVWSPSDADSYAVTIKADIEDDVRSENDSLIHYFEVREHIGHGGPDAIGYEWFDNLYVGPEAPEFEGIDTTEAEPLDLVGDDNFVIVDIPFDFIFYGKYCDSVWITTNGIITFDSIASPSYINMPFPTSIYPGAAAPFWDDLKVDTAAVIESKVFTAIGLAGDGRQIFRIIFSGIFIRGTSERFDIEITLYEDNDIRFQYANFSHPESDRIAGSSSTVGISSSDASMGLMYQYNFDPPENPIMENFALMFMAPEVFLDTIPPAIAHVHDSASYLCAAEDFTLKMSAEINDLSEILADTLYYEVAGSPHFVIAETIVENMHYYRLTDLNIGEEFEYYIVAWDNDGNRGTLPFDAPATTFHSVILDPHQGCVEGFAYFKDNFADTVDVIPPAFSWIELDPDEGGTGTVLEGVSDDWTSEPIAIGRPVWFLGTIESPYIKICSNGWITFDTTTFSSLWSGDIPHTNEPNYTIAGLWTDLDPEPPEAGLDTGRIFYGFDEDSARFIVEWKNFYRYGDISGEYATFQIHIGLDDYHIVDSLFEGEIHFLSVPASCRNAVTIGIESIEGLFGLAYQNSGEPDACLPVDSSAVFFYNFVDYIAKSKPYRVAVGAPYPNPFNSSMQINLNLAILTSVKADVLAIDGRMVASLADGFLELGAHRLTWNADNDLPSGIYFVRICAGNEKFLRKVVLLR